jgi:hypothetical protein
MLFSEEDAPLLKAWIVKRIEDTSVASFSPCGAGMARRIEDSANIYNSSDADADVLAEYVIALLKHDGSADAVRKLCEQEIPDFLSEGAQCYSHVWDD